MQIPDSEIEKALKLNHPDIFGANDAICANHFSRTNAYIIERFKVDAQGYPVRDEKYYWVTYKTTLMGVWERDTDMLTLYNIEKIPTNAVQNSLRKILANMGVANTIGIKVFNTGTYKRMVFNSDVDNYLYSGAKIQVFREEYRCKVLTEQYKSYGRPEAYEKISDW